MRVKRTLKQNRRHALSSCLQILDIGAACAHKYLVSSHGLAAYQACGHLIKPCCVFNRNKLMHQRHPLLQKKRLHSQWIKCASTASRS
jgi:hypothetical protein